VTSKFLIINAEASIALENEPPDSPPPASIAGLSPPPPFSPKKNADSLIRDNPPTSSSFPEEAKSRKQKSKRPEIVVKGRRFVSDLSH
jgi:hypothetical protein